MRSRVHPKYKTKYQVSNWSKYDRALVQRGDITLWISEDAIASWKPAPTGRRGARRDFKLALEYRSELERGKALEFTRVLADTGLTAVPTRGAATMSSSATCTVVFALLAASVMSAQP